jgi:hypothetical protein
MQMEEKSSKYAWSSKMGLATGALLLILGLFIFFTRPANATSRALPVFMIIYGMFRLGFSAYQLFGKKKNELGE